MNPQPKQMKYIPPKVYPGRVTITHFPDGVIMAGWKKARQIANIYELGTIINQPKRYVKGKPLLCVESCGSVETVIYIGTELEFNRVADKYNNVKKEWILTTGLNIVKMIVASRKNEKSAEVVACNKFNTEW